MKTLLLILIASFAFFGTFAQKAKGNSKKAGSQVILYSNYRCPMHPEVVSNKAGKCNKCNMNLTLSKKEQMKKEVVKDYRCPMHKEVVSATAGSCAKCGKALTVIDRRGSKQGKAVYECTMHPEVIADKSGKCPKCGMDLTKASR